MDQGGPTLLNMTRRSTRVRVSIPVTISSLESALKFSETCHTVFVNTHGCALRSSQPLKFGTRVHLKVAPGRETGARVVAAQPLGDGNANWILGLELEKPGNIWGIDPCPKDWMQDVATPEAAASGNADQASAALNLKMPVWPLAAPASRKRLSPGPSDREPRQEIAAAVAALKAEVAESLSALPEMVRQQLVELQEPMLARANQQAAVMSKDLLRPLQDELAKARQEIEVLRKAVASAASAQTALPQLNQDMREQAAAVMKMLQSLRDELARQQHKLTELDETVAAQLDGIGSLVQQHTESKLQALRENVRAELQQAISAVRSKLVESLRTQVTQELQQVAERQAVQLRQAADDACNSINRLHHDIEETMGASLCQQSTEVTASFEAEIGKIAQQAIEQWRSTLATNLESLTTLLTQQLPLKKKHS